MLAGFYVFHKKGYSGHEVPPQGENIYSFKTCLRQIYVSWFDEQTDVKMSADFDVLRGQKAYEFLLQVVCGLHSPVVGETEVFGQFKTFWGSHEFFYPLKQILDSIIIDAKQVRGKHLKNLGGQSYGSLIRKMLKKPAQVSIIGSGAFVEDILPWIYKDENKITIYARNLVKAQEIQSRHKKIEIKDIKNAKIESAVVIIAAPLTAEEINLIVANKTATVIDLRGESRWDPCTGFQNYKDLSTFFQAIENNQVKISHAKTLAESAIGEMGRKRFYTESLRPFGWDDICVW